MQKIRLLADENIPFLEQLLPSSIELTQVPGRKICSALLKEQDILLVRSVTKVNSALLENTTVQFIGSTTIGTDHVNLQAIQKQNIAFAHAPGSNAMSVVEYVLSALFNLHNQQSIDLNTAKIGIIGCGHVGYKLAFFLKKMRLMVKIYDPFLEKNKAFNHVKTLDFCSFSEVLTCDIITLHVPFTVKDSFPTHHLLNEKALFSLKEEALLINTARGGVIDQAALKRLLSKRKKLKVVLDVWQNEPTIDVDLMERCTFATPHIAGYAFEGKRNGVIQVIEQLKKWMVCHTLNHNDSWPEAPALPALSLNIDKTGNEAIQNIFLSETQSLKSQTLIENLSAYLEKFYSIADESTCFKTQMSQASHEQYGAIFDLYRKNYPIRREAFAYFATSSFFNFGGLA